MKKITCSHATGKLHQKIAQGEATDQTTNKAHPKGGNNQRPSNTIDHNNRIQVNVSRWARCALKPSGQTEDLDVPSFGLEKVLETSAELERSVVI